MHESRKAVSKSKNGYILLGYRRIALRWILGLQVSIIMRIVALMCKLHLPRYGIQNNRFVLASGRAGGLQSVTNSLSQLENMTFSPFPHISVFLKELPDRDDKRDSATYCGTATPNRGMRTEAKKLKIWGWLNNFICDCLKGS